MLAMPYRARPLSFIALFILSTSGLALAEDIDGVQPAALDQPRINVVVRRAPRGPALSAKMLGEEVFNVEAFLDTGASGVLISSGTAEHLGVKREATPTGEVRFEDVGVGGGSKF